MTTREAREQRRAIQDDFWFAQRRLTHTSNPDDQQLLLKKLAIRQTEVARLTAIINGDDTQEMTR